MSRFVSAGAINAETGEAVAAAATTTDKPGSAAAEVKKNAEWEAVQKELEAERKRREEARIKAVEGGEKSLYDILQANKAAKQAAFEEQNKIKNQFRPLDDDEIEFLDEVRSSARAAEERVRRETEEGLAAFRRAQNQKRPVGGGDGGGDDGEEGAGVDAGAGDGAADGSEEWAVGPRKRRKGREGRGFGVKREKSDGEKVEKIERRDGETKEAAQGSPPAPAKPKMGLVTYGSDSDDD